MKPLQPSHTQLLINTAWGLDAAAIDKAAAKARGLVKWKGRWVTREERKQLKAEHYAYSGIRAVGVLGLLGGLATAATIFGPTSLLGKAWGLVAAATILISSGQILAYQSLGRPLLL